MWSNNYSTYCEARAKGILKTETQNYPLPRAYIKGHYNILDKAVILLWNLIWGFKNGGNSYRGLSCEFITSFIQRNSIMVTFTDIIEDPMETETLLQFSTGPASVQHLACNACSHWLQWAQLATTQLGQKKNSYIHHYKHSSGSSYNTSTSICIPLMIRVSWV